MRIPDSHIHSRFSPDSSMEPWEAAEAAIKAGITDICFTEHIDLGHCTASFNRIPNFAEIRQTISKLRNTYPQIQIRSGLEVGYISHTAKKTAAVISQQPFDYTLLSTHCVDGLDCYFPESNRGHDKITAYKRYLETLYESVTDKDLADHFDCVGHIGYIAKCGHYEDNAMPYQLFPKMLDEILLAIIQKKKGIEVNTSGLKKAGHVLPHPSIISRYCELGGTIITLGSDAHSPDRVGANIVETLKLIRDCGFTQFAVFHNHVPAFYSIY